MGIYSFNGNKIITTSGGGALVGKNKEHMDLAVKLSTQAREDAPFYQHEMVGYNYRLSNVSAGIGRGQMMVLDERIAQRRANFDRYMRLFENLGLREKIEVQEEKVIRFSNRWLTAVYFDPAYFVGDTSEKLRIHLDSLNIENQDHYGSQCICSQYLRIVEFMEVRYVKSYSTMAFVFPPDQT